MILAGWAISLLLLAFFVGYVIGRKADNIDD